MDLWGATCEKFLVHPILMWIWISKTQSKRQHQNSYLASYLSIGIEVDNNRMYVLYIYIIEKYWLGCKFKNINTYWFLTRIAFRFLYTSFFHSSFGVLLKQLLLHHWTLFLLSLWKLYRFKLIEQFRSIFFFSLEGSILSKFLDIDIHSFFSLNFWFQLHFISDFFAV